MRGTSGGFRSQLWVVIAALLLLSMAAFQAASLQEARARSVEARAARAGTSESHSTLANHGFAAASWTPARAARRFAARVANGTFPPPPPPVGAAAPPGRREVAPASGVRVPPSWRARGGAGFRDPPRILAGSVASAHDKEHRGIWRGPANSAEWP